MKFNITGSRLADQNGKPQFGFEIQPPLFNGNQNTVKSPANELAEALVDKPPEDSFSTGYDHQIERVWVPRDDQFGTVVIIEGNFYGQPSAGAIAQRIGTLINPAGRHEVAIEILPAHNID